ncbi:hypothetical protein ['Camptotheca acuminata' phytoplasma]|uniref:hypothetical protein n=1 Tax='Camptotheca acuminata' phytoplasma TaxID=3239192 RepID=UPI003519F6FD
MKETYGEESTTKLYKAKTALEYYDDNAKQFALICINKGYSRSSKIELPYLIFIPKMEENELINGNKYFDASLQELEEYCINNSKFIHEVDLGTSLQQIYKETNKEKNNIIEKKLDKLDDLFEDQDFKEQIEKK